MTSMSTTSHRPWRVALAAVGVSLALLTSLYLWATTGGATAAPMIICLHANDITCSNNYFLGWDQAEHVAQIRALLAGLAGLILIGSSGLWSARARRATRK